MKILIIALTVLAATQASAAEVCTVSPFFYGPNKTVVNCSDVDSGNPVIINKMFTVVLKEKLEQGFQIQSTVATPVSNGTDSTPCVIYTLVKP